MPVPHETLLVRALLDLVHGEPAMLNALKALRQADIPDAWIGGGFIRNAVWDRLHGFAIDITRSDVDVGFFDAAPAPADQESGFEARLRALCPGLDWTVRNQARMHAYNGHEPYRDMLDAATHWVARCNAVALRLGADDTIEMLAPFGLEDVFAMRVHPTPIYLTTPVRTARFYEMMQAKRWNIRWPGVRITARHELGERAEPVIITREGEKTNQQRKGSPS